MHPRRLFLRIPFAGLAGLARAADTRPVIAAFGDSLTAGYGLAAGLSYPDFLQKIIDQNKYKYRVVNLGISGDTTGGGLSRLQSVLALKPELVILELGANDGLRGLPLSATRHNLDQMIDAIRKSGAKVLLAGITLPRNYGPDYIQQFDSIYTDLAKKHNVPLLPFLLEGVAMSPELMQGDRLHPKADGNQKVAETVWRYISKMLRR